MRLLQPILLASFQVFTTNPSGTDLIDASCDSDGFHLVIDESVRKGIYYFIEWPSTFVDGQKSVYEMPNSAGSACLADGSGSNWEFHTGFNDCNIQPPTIYTDQATKIEYFIYTLYLNFDNSIDPNSGTGNLQQLEQVEIECQIARRWQEDGTVGNVSIKKAEIIDDIKIEGDLLWKQLQLDVYKGGFNKPNQQLSWEGPLKTSDSVKIGEKIELRIRNTPPHTILSDWNVAIEDCWASTVENRAIDTDMDTGVIHFDLDGTDGVPGSASPVKHETVKFWGDQCPNFNWVGPIYSSPQNNNVEIFLKQFAFNDNDGKFNQNFYYHCIVVLCDKKNQCAKTCADRPSPSDNAPSGRRRRALVTSRRMKQDNWTRIDFSRKEVRSSGEINPSINLKLENACEHGMEQDGAAFVCKENAAGTIGVSLLTACLTYIVY